MTRLVSVLNLDRRTLRLGTTRVAPAYQNPAPTQVDLDNGLVRRDLKRYYDRFLVFNDAADTPSATNQVKLVGATVGTAGGVAAWQNTTGADVLVDKAIFDVTTIAAGAGTVSIGVAANGTTLSATLIDTLDVHSATGTFDNITSHGTNGKSIVKVPAGQWVTASKQSGSVTGLVSVLTLHFSPA